MVLLNDKDGVISKISPKKAEVQSQMKPDQEGQEDDEQCTLDIEDAEDFETLWHAEDL